MKAIWKGNISFALVTIPISLCSATRSDEVAFHYLHKKDRSKISYKRFCEVEDKEVPWEEITRGYEYEKGHHIEITEEDFDSVDIELTRTIQIVEFVNEDEIDPVYFDRPYYLEPQKGGERAYGLMREALAQSKKVGIAKVVLKSRQHLAAVKAVGDLMTLQTMRFVHEIVDPSQLNLPKVADITPKEMDLANMLIDSMSDKFEPAKYKDDYREKLLAIIQQKVQGVATRVASGRTAKAPPKVVDLMEILKESLKETKKKPTPAQPTREETVAAGSSRSSRIRKKVG